MNDIKKKIENLEILFNLGHIVDDGKNVKIEGPLKNLRLEPEDGDILEELSRVVTFSLINDGKELIVREEGDRVYSAVLDKELLLVLIEDLKKVHAKMKEKS